VVAIRNFFKLNVYVRQWYTSLGDYALVLNYALRFPVGRVILRMATTGASFVSITGRVFAVRSQR
jgi:hypothetical protein